MAKSTASRDGNLDCDFLELGNERFELLVGGLFRGSDISLC
jgi:hypothetical protein